MSVRTVGGFTQGDVCEVLWGDEDQVPEWWDAQVIAISLKNVTVKFLTSEALISDDPEVLMWAQMTPRFSCLLPVSELGSKLREQQLFTNSTQSKSSRSRGARVVPVGCKRSAEGQLRREGMGGIGGQRQDTATARTAGQTLPATAPKSMAQRAPMALPQAHSAR